MNSKIKIVLIGGGDHCTAVIDVIERTGEYQIIGFVDKCNDSKTLNDTYPWLGNDEMLPELAQQYENFHITIGHIKSSRPRRILYERLQSIAGRFPIIICPTATISPSAKIGPGTVVMSKVVVSAQANIGCNSIVNSGTIIEHHSRVGDHVHISTSATLNGRCAVGSDSFVGSGGIIREGVSIGRNAIIGAASYVNRNIPDNVTAFGVPAKAQAR